MKKIIILFFIIAMVSATLSGCNVNTYKAEINIKTIQLPEQSNESNTSIEQAILGRRSARNFSDDQITLSQLSQLLWAAQGMTSPEGLRSVPSAGGIYPLKVYIVIGNAENIKQGIYVYDPEKHQINKIKENDWRKEITEAASGQDSINNAPASIIISAIYEQTIQRYGERGIRYVHMEAGHTAQNIYLQSVSLELGTVAIGAFDDNKVKKILDMPDNESPLYIMPIGKNK